jgi:transcriptional regulator with XRE-family HTH domain
MRQRARLARRRKVLGFSQERLAESVAVDRSTIARWERGETEPHPAQRPGLARALRVTVAELDDLLSDANEAVPPAANQNPLDTEWTIDGLLQLARRLDGDSADEPLTGAQLTTLAQGWQIADPAPLGALRGEGRVDEGVSRSFGDLARALYMGQNLLACGAEQTLALTEPLVSFAIRLMRQGSFTPDSRTELYRHLSGLARVAGWASFNRGSPAMAQRHYAVALRAAHLARDREQGAFIISGMAFQASSMAQHHEALALIEGARRGGSGALGAPMLTLLTTWEARAHAFTHDKHEFERALTRAEGHFERRRPDEGPRFLHWLIQPALIAEIGHCFSLVGDDARAVALLEEGALYAYQGGYDHVLREIYTAEAHLGLGDVERAAHYGHRALDSLGSAPVSPQVMASLTELNRRLSPHGRMAAVAELTSRIPPEVLSPGGRDGAPRPV